MLDWIKNFLESLWDIILSLVGFVEQIAKGLFDLLKYLPEVVSMVTSSIGWLPSVLTVFATLSITVSVIMLIAGRNNN